MPYGWENYLVFDADGRINVIDAELAKQIRDHLKSNKNKIYMYYVTPGGPGQKDNMLCSCRAQGGK
ncbi:MAG TPA: hypothetical protein VFP58_12725 [Candidatus Eisenbacteria bacterium]|nr:hypothetical protein [Candidatus Eisenbacteria bacterium]